jgi:hypothetical protein
MADSEFTLRAVDCKTGERVSYPLAAAEAERVIAACEGLPNPQEDVLDDEEEGPDGRPAA